MDNYKQELETDLWAIANDLRGSMDANEFKNYILGFIVYKFLSEKIENNINKILKDEIKYENLDDDKELKEFIEEQSVDNLGYFISYDGLFRNIIKKAKEDGDFINDLHSALQEIMNSSKGTDSAGNFKDLFDDVDLYSAKFGDPSTRKRKIKNILLRLNNINFKSEENDSDILGDVYEYLIGKFASDSGKKAGEYYTPKEVSEVLAKIVTLDKPSLSSVYDPTCGSGSLLLKVIKEANVSRIYGQESNPTTYNLARMNMLLHDIDYNSFFIKLGDSLEEDKFKKRCFDAIVANPPFSAHWSADKKFSKDRRFKNYDDLAPKNIADYAFVLHMLCHLNDKGTMAVVLPHGVLSRVGIEEKIRTQLVNERLLVAVIGLPRNLFYGTEIPAVILVFNKENKDDRKSIFFIDASNGFEMVTNQNRLRKKDITKIIDVYKSREEIEGYSSNVTFDKIKENKYNLNIRGYVDTFEEEEQITIDELLNEYKEVNENIKHNTEKIKNYCDRLDMDYPFFLWDDVNE